MSKWLNGEAIANADSVVVLCSWLKVRREWLEYGVLPKSSAFDSSIEKLTTVGTSNAVDVPSRFDKVPPDLMGPSGAWCEEASISPMV